MPDDYNPVQVLQDEVRRFQRTNTFTPMQVTGFYIQAAVVLNYVRDLEERIDILARVAGHVCRNVDDENRDELVRGLSGILLHLSRTHRFPAPENKD